MNATECFTLRELGRCTVDGEAYVLYSDGAMADAVPASEYDEVHPRYHADRFRVEQDGDTYGIRDSVRNVLVWGRRFQHPIDAESYLSMVQREHSSMRYSLWCSDDAMAVGYAPLLARILAACGVECVQSGTCGHVEAANDVEPPDNDEGDEADIEQAPGESGYMACSCRDCFEGPIVGSPGDMCDGCIEAGCTLGEHECSNPAAYGGDEVSNG
jgi:hypothetical protein